MGEAVHPIQGPAVETTSLGEAAHPAQDPTVETASLGEAVHPHGADDRVSILHPLITGTIAALPLPITTTRSLQGIALLFETADATLQLDIPLSTQPDTIPATTQSIAIVQQAILQSATAEFLPGAPLPGKDITIRIARCPKDPTGLHMAHHPTPSKIQQPSRRITLTHALHHQADNHYTH